MHSFMKLIIDQTLDGSGHSTVFLRQFFLLNSCFSSIFYEPPVCATVRVRTTSKREQRWQAKMARWKTFVKLSETPAEKKKALHMY